MSGASSTPSDQISPPQGPDLPKVLPDSPIYVDYVRTKRLSTGLHPLLPLSISSDINSLQTKESASKYFATKRSGMLRSRMPFDRIMVWQKQPLSSSLLVLSKVLAKDAVTAFKVIQHVMGEREKRVEQARPVGPTPPREEDKTVLEEIRWMLQLGCGEGDMRDEIYSQLVKQLTKNPER